jgi:hypothetical protein
MRGRSRPSVQAAVARLVAVPPPATPGLVALAAPEPLARAPVTRALTALAARGRRLAVIVCDNQFDVYAIARAAPHYGGDPGTVLQRLYNSRAETCHQVHACILRLKCAQSEWSAIFVLGLLEHFYDEDIRLEQVQWLLTDSLRHLKHLSVAGIPVIITVAPPRQPGRESLLQVVARAVDVYAEPLPSARQLAAPLQLELGV